MSTSAWIISRCPDAFAKTQIDGGLHRNFQEYSTHADCDLVSMGVSAIGALRESYSQNHHHLEAYNAALDAGRLPVARGLALDVDDQLRRAGIVQLICHFRLVFTSFEQSHTLDFRNYFARELLALAPLQQMGCCGWVRTAYA